MFETKDIENLAVEMFSFLKDCGFRKSLIEPKNFQSTISYLSDFIGIDVELDWREMSAFVLLVRLESGKLPNGYYVSNTDGNICRIHLQKALYNLGYRDEQINSERLYKNQKRKQQLPSTENIKSVLESNSNLLNKTIDLIIKNQESVFTTGTV